MRSARRFLPPSRSAARSNARRPTGSVCGCARARQAPRPPHLRRRAPPPAAVRAVSAKEAKLRELKHFHDAGLVSDEVYIDRQKAILAEP